MQQKIDLVFFLFLFLLLLLLVVFLQKYLRCKILRLRNVVRKAAAILAVMCGFYFWFDVSCLLCWCNAFFSALTTHE